LILLSSALLGLAVADLIRWSPGRSSTSRAVAAICGGAVLATALPALAGSCWGLIVGVACGGTAALALWVAFDYKPLQGRPKLQLAEVTVVLMALFALSGTVAPIQGPLESWYYDLDFGFVNSVPVDQFVLGVASSLFLIASANRIVRLVLEAAAIRWDKGEQVLAGGRILGPLERLIVTAIVLAGDPAAAAIVVTGKGLLRFPEIRSESKQQGPDLVTEYFLIGTFTSLFLAGLIGVLLSAAS
jgi:hypothetical protein